ncbi:hypothetical protein GGF31_007147 [Allomyces arbusculus]|nr:hypothetical protein GGF31_007147 [Allomyces arbusculus]
MTPPTLLLARTAAVRAARRLPVHATSTAKRTLSLAPGQMLSRQHELPRLPVPDLAHTAKVYLASVRPLVDDAAYAQTESAVADLLAPGSLGEQLQARLLAHDAAQPDSWLEEFWLRNAYLIWRCPTMLNVNWWCQFADAPHLMRDAEFAQGTVPPKGTFTNVQFTRAATLTAGFLDAHLAIQAEALPVDATKSGSPFCMNQYKYLFGVTRIPEPACDKIETPWPVTAKHIIVLIRGQPVKLTVIDAHGKRASVRTLEHQLRAAVALVDAALPFPDMGVLTAEDRDVWAKARQDLEFSPANRATLKDLDEALFAVALDDVTLGDGSHEATHHQIFHNRANNRWFDKAIQLVVTNTARAGVNGEHSPSDAVVPGSVFNYVLANEEAIRAHADHGAADLPAPQRLVWDLPHGMDRTLETARTNVDAAVDAIDSTLLHATNTVGGASWIKQHAKMSPDSYAQLALQLTYWRDQNGIPATYESASTRAYKHGRTECVRTQSTASAAFVQAFDKRAVTDAEKLALMRTAAATHAATMKEASQGRGCDRHLLGLRLMLQEGESLKLFQDPSFALSSTFRLSTSNMSPGTYLYGGFGAVTANGYGCNYAVDPESFKFSVSHWKGSSTDASRFRDTLHASLTDIYQLVNRVD